MTDDPTAAARQRVRRERKKAGLRVLDAEVDPDTLDKLVKDGRLERGDLADRRRLAKALGYCLDDLAFLVTRDGVRE